MTTKTRYSTDAVYVPVELGTIRIGQTFQTDKGPRPQKLDHFLVTTLVRTSHQWGEHELMAGLRAQQNARDKESAARRGAEHNQPPEETKIRSIPIRVQFDDPSLTLNARYEAFDRSKGRPVCASSESGVAVRATDKGMERVECSGPESCPFANAGDNIRCKFFGRLSVQIQGQRQDDNVFILRTTSINTIRTLESKLRRYHALFRGRLAGVPFRLHLRSRTTAGSHWGTFYFLDLDLDGVTIPEAAELADKTAQERAAQPLLDWKALEEAVRAGLANGRLNHDPVEGALMEEFFTADECGATPSAVRQETPEASQEAAGPLVHLPNLQLNNPSLIRSARL